jgi:hypothetical protein
MAGHDAGVTLKVEGPLLHRIDELLDRELVCCERLPTVVRLK